MITASSATPVYCFTLVESKVVGLVLQTRNQVTELLRDREVLKNVAQVYPTAKPVLSTTLLSCISHASGEAPQDPHSQAPSGHPPAGVTEGERVSLMVLLRGSVASESHVSCLSIPSSASAG